jgi:hypothetical protein
MAFLLLLWLLCPGTVDSAFAEPSQATAAKEVKGDVLYWEGEELIVKDRHEDPGCVRETEDRGQDFGAGSA